MTRPKGTVSRTVRAAVSARSIEREPISTSSPCAAYRIASPSPSSPVPPRIAIFTFNLRPARPLLPAPVLVESYAISARDDEEQAEFERTNAAHDRLLRFETMLRRFIDERMTRDFGPNWTEKCLPDGMRDDWVDKRDRAQAKGEKPRPLIAYADFTDYEKIIRKKQNWNTTFKGVFQRGEFVTESFQRLYPIRLCTMHARLITADDELYLFVEVKRFLQVIGVPKA